MATYLIEKDRALLNEVLFDALPELFPTEEDRRRALVEPKIYNITYLVEKAMERYGDYKYVDEEGYDFDDYSDSKTLTLALVGKDYSPSAVCQVKAKIGPMRICLFNKWKNKGRQIDFFFFPKSAYNRSINFTYNVSNNSYGKKHKYKVPDFITLCTKVDKYFTNSLAEFMS